MYATMSTMPIVTYTPTGMFEDASIADGCMHLSEKSDCLARMLSEQAATLTTNFEGPLKEFVRNIRAAKAAIADRTTALAALSQARNDVDVRRGKLAKLRGTPGIREEKAAEAERELNEAQKRAEKAKKEYEVGGDGGGRWGFARVVLTSCVCHKHTHTPCHTLRALYSACRWSCRAFRGSGHRRWQWCCVNLAWHRHG